MMQILLLPIYLRERFNLWQFIPLSLVITGSASFIGVEFFNTTIPPIKLLIATLAFLLFLFRLRLFDEIKDEVHDKTHYPNRPLSRGVVSKKWVKQMITATLLIECVIVGLSSLLSLYLFVLSLSYSLIMYKEFFISKLLRNHFVIYSLLHEALSIPLFLYIYTLLGIFTGLFNSIIVLILGMHIGGLFGLEVARKLRRAEGENKAGDTYTEHIGVFGATIACGILFTLSGLSTLVITYVTSSNFYLFTLFLGILWVALLLSLFIFIKTKSITSARQVFISGAIFTLIPQGTLGLMYLVRIL